MLTEVQIFYDALSRYAKLRRDFATAMENQNFRMPTGKKPSSAEKLEEKNMADRCEMLAERAKEKMDSPIILVN